MAKAACGLCLMTLTVIPGPAIAFAVNDVASEFRNGALLITANVSFEFTDQVIEALESGIPMTITTQIRVYRQRDAMWDKRIADRLFAEQIRYRTFPVTYVVESYDRTISGAYGRYRDAVAALGGTRLYRVDLDGIATEAVDGMRASIRVALDRAKLPGALRMRSFFDADWRLLSGWVDFKVK